MVSEEVDRIHESWRIDRMLFDAQQPTSVLLNNNSLLPIQGELFNVEAIETDRIRVDRVWHKRDAKRVLLYKMVLNPRQKLLLR